MREFNKNKKEGVKNLDHSPGMAVQKRIEYSSGDSYEGEWSSDGKRQGKGRLKTVSGDEYYGEFKNGFFHGLGVLVLSDGGKYEGNFELGRYHGYGVYTAQDKTKYEVLDTYNDPRIHKFSLP